MANAYREKGVEDGPVFHVLGSETVIAVDDLMAAEDPKALIDARMLLAGEQILAVWQDAKDRLIPVEGK